MMYAQVLPKLNCDYTSYFFMGSSVVYPPFDCPIAFINCYVRASTLFKSN